MKKGETNKEKIRRKWNRNRRKRKKTKAEREGENIIDVFIILLSFQNKQQ
jgi:hypothetical protein